MRKVDTVSVHLCRRFSSKTSSSEVAVDAESVFSESICYLYSCSHSSSKHRDVDVVLVISTWYRMFSRVGEYSAECLVGIFLSPVSGGGSCEVATSVICLNVSQFALRKFHRFTSLHAIGAVNHGEEISGSRCCDRGNLSSNRRVGMPVSAVWANARSGLVYEFQRCE